MMVKKLLIISSLFMALAIVLTIAGKVSAQEPNSVAQKYNVTFSIAALGNCKDYNDCRTYCEDPLQADACIAFAKSKGFYKDESKDKERILAAAKNELGCDSEISCRDFCSNKANSDKCSQFAQSHGLSGGTAKNPEDQKILEKAKEILGCNSPQSCSNFCSKEENRQKCSDFAREVGLRGGEQKSGPGGCTSEDTCKAFCSIPANFQTCKQFSQVHSEGQFTGLGGCSDEASCRSYCQSNPQACGMRSGASGGNVMSRDQQEATCKAGGGTCVWKNDICNCQGYHSGSSGTNYTPYPNSTYYPKPTYYPTSSGGNTMSRDQQQAACSAGGGTCVWNNDICNCQGYHAPSPFTTSTQPPSQTSQSQPPAPQTQPDFATMCAQTSGCSWTGSTCQCSPVKGIETTASWFKQMLFFIQNLFGNK